VSLLEPDSDSRLEGVLHRKHEWESRKVKASHRTWDKLYAIQKEKHISFYKDQKHAKTVSDLLPDAKPTDSRKHKIIVRVSRLWHRCVLFFSFVIDWDQTVDCSEITQFIAQSSTHHTLTAIQTVSIRVVLLLE